MENKSWGDRHPVAYINYWFLWALFGGFVVMVPIQNIYGRSKVVLVITSATYYVVSALIFFTARWFIRRKRNKK